MSKTVMVTEKTDDRYSRITYRYVVEGSDTVPLRYSDRRWYIQPTEMVLVFGKLGNDPWALTDGSAVRGPIARKNRSAAVTEVRLYSNALDGWDGDWIPQWAREIIDARLAELNNEDNA